MERVRQEDLNRYIAESVKVCIHGGQGEDMAPWLDKRIKRVGLCPDQTHLRIFFDDHYFFAVPLSSEVSQTEQEWSAYDRYAGLYYVVRNKEE
ncbi:hypothetical protein [Thalassobacillus pellis]|uniref:hypothetical protein n=1 Tax=Thalassobacillus pellis TaxID=748008 RepID=UPI001961D688|nr:hypothetical protein [Thalassobacillus pellis]